MDYEYVIYIYNNIPKSFYKDLLLYSKIIDFNRSYNNDIKLCQQIFSIITQQRFMFNVLFDAHEKIVKDPEQLV